jgi:hypothetical protein
MPYCVYKQVLGSAALLSLICTKDHIINTHDTWWVSPLLQEAAVERYLASASELKEKADTQQVLHVAPFTVSIVPYSFVRWVGRSVGRAVDSATAILSVTSLPKVYPGT